MHQRGSPVSGASAGIAGESGYGKPTPGDTLLGLNEPTAGRVYFESEGVTERLQTDPELRIALQTDPQIIQQGLYK